MFLRCSLKWQQEPEGVKAFHTSKKLPYVCSKLSQKYEIRLKYAKGYPADIYT